MHTLPLTDHLGIEREGRVRLPAADQIRGHEMEASCVDVLFTGVGGEHRCQLGFAICPGAARQDEELRARQVVRGPQRDRKSTRLNSSHSQISYAVFCLKKKKSTHCAMSTATSIPGGWSSKATFTVRLSYSPVVPPIGRASATAARPVRRVSVHHQHAVS